MQLAATFLSLLAFGAVPQQALAVSPVPSLIETLAQTELERAVVAFEAGEWQQVLEIVQAAPEGTDDGPRLAYLAGETQLILGRREQAATSFRFVLEQRPDAVPAKVGLARALTGTGGLEEAEQLLTGVLAAEPKDVGAKTAMGLLLAQLDRLEDARAELAGASKLAPRNALTARAYVEVLLRSELLPEAAGVAEAFAVERPEHPMGHFLLAVVMERDGQDELAITSYQAALAKDPNFLDAHKNLAILCHTLSNTYQDKARTKLAFAHYERYFALGGSDAQLRATYDNLLGFKEQILGS